MIDQLLDGVFLKQDVTVRSGFVYLHRDGSLIAFHTAGADCLKGINCALSFLRNSDIAGIGLPVSVTHLVLEGGGTQIFRCVGHRQRDILIGPGAGLIAIRADGYHRFDRVDVGVGDTFFPAYHTGSACGPEGVGAVFCDGIEIDIRVVIGWSKRRPGAIRILDFHLGNTGKADNGDNLQSVLLAIVCCVAGKEHSRHPLINSHRNRLAALTLPALETARKT